jgi:phthalate 4,5-cis-dihydrodiol dehydrogenase
MGGKIRLGVAGLGRAFTLMLPAFTRDPRVELAAAADPREEARLRFSEEFGAPAYSTVEELCKDASLEAIYIATPHQFHSEHAKIAAGHGKHILVEKPMALSIEECNGMIEAAEQTGVYLVVGHSHSFDAPVEKTRQLIESGNFGSLRMITALNFTDFLYRPRRREELETNLGGGVIFSQAAHQIDIVRLLGGGVLRSVRAHTGAWDAARPAEGAYCALLTFDSGAFASITYSGYAHFDSDEFCDWTSELGQAKSQDGYGAARRNLAGAPTAEEEASLKNMRAYGYLRGGATPTAPMLLHEHFGFVLASCERADLRPMPRGVAIYDDGRQWIESLPAPVIPRVEVIDELFQAVRQGIEPLHRGEWGLATLEACQAILRSAREKCEIVLSHQTGLA